jgi:hypothetical protein
MKAPKKRENKEQNGRTQRSFKKTNEPSKRVNHKENINFWNFLLSQEAYQIRKCDETLPIINLMKAPKKRGK